MKDDSDSAVMVGNVVYGLPGSGIFDAAVGGVVAEIESLTQFRKI